MAELLKALSMKDNLLRKKQKRKQVQATTLLRINTFFNFKICVKEWQQKRQTMHEDWALYHGWQPV